MSFKIPYRGNLTWLQDRTIFFTRHGSHAYGTNIASSDEDFKGVAIPPSEYFTGFVKRFEQAETKNHKDKKEKNVLIKPFVDADPALSDPTLPDVVVYNIIKFFEMASNCNPNIIEMLWTDPSDHLICTRAGQIMVDAKQDFLSKKAKFTFSGYAVAQLKRINVHYKWLKNPPKGSPTRQEFGLPERTVIPADQLAAAHSAVQKVMDGWEWKDLDNLDPAFRIQIMNAFTDKLEQITQWSWDQNRDKIWMAAATSLGFNTNFIELLDMERRYNAKKKEWSNYNHWVENRNPQRAELEAKFGYDTKHAMHLVRLMRMCEEILMTGKVAVKRMDRDELLSIRYGEWPHETLIEWAAAKDKILTGLYNSCSILPKEPDRSKLDKICTSLVEESLRAA